MITFKPTRNIDLIEAVGNHPDIIAGSNNGDGYDYKPDCRYFEVNVHGQFGGIVYYQEIQPLTFDCHAMYLPEVRGFSKEIGLAFWRYILTNTTVQCVTSFAARKFRHGQMYCAMIGLNRVARVIGCLLEKQVTTPEQYPLSVNGVVTACNQKTNREPVMNLSESEVQEQLDNLVKRHYLRTVSGFGNRVTKYEQRFCNSEFGDLKLSAAEVALITTLLLRGAQTPGELRSRAARMYEFSDMAEVESTLEQLANREDGPFVVRLAREPGKRESRYMHLFSGEVENPPAVTDMSNAFDGDLQARVEALEIEVAELKQRLDSLLAHLGD